MGAGQKIVICHAGDAHMQEKPEDDDDNEEQEEELAKPSRENWYKRGANYWMQIDPTVDGMLGGFGHVSKLGEMGEWISHVSSQAHGFPPTQHLKIAKDPRLF